MENSRANAHRLHYRFGKGSVEPPITVSSTFRNVFDSASVSCQLSFVEIMKLIASKD